MAMMQCNGDTKWNDNVESMVAMFGAMVSWQSEEPR